MTAKLKPGRVVSFRLNPTDCISCVDVAAAINVDTRSMGFDQVVRMAVSSLLESARINGVIPTRAGFEYESLVAVPFKGTGKQGRAERLRITALADKFGPDQAKVQPVMPESPAHMRARIKFQQLDYKLEKDPLNATQEERDEHQALARQLLETE